MMEKQDQATQEKGGVICPNCGSAQMEEIRNPLATMDQLEWHSFITTALVSSILIFNLGQHIATYFSSTRNAPDFFGYALVAVLVLCAIAFSYFRIADLSVERYRHDGICVWYVRCAKCHSKYRVVRPFGTIPPWEIEDDADEAEFEEVHKEVSNAADS